MAVRIQQHVERHAEIACRLPWIQTLTTDLSSDPTRTVRQLQGQENRINTIIGRLEGLAASAMNEVWIALSDAHTHLSSARSAAAAASTNLFADEPLPDIGSDVWKVLWEAARDYSRASAYPDRPFPVTESSAHCVLCQQPLSEEAAQRLRSFETFVQDESKRREQEAADAYNERREEVSSKAVLMADLLAIVAVIRDDIGQEELAAPIER